MMHDNEIYSYELWNGKKVVGFYHTLYPLLGKYCLFLDAPKFKRIYTETYKVCKVPIITRLISYNKVDIVIRRCLDVRKKSPRQITKIKYCI